MLSPESTVPSYTGVLLGGGRSVRMGANKAFLDFGGIPLWRRQYQLLGDLGVDERFVSLRPDDVWTPSGVATVFDDGKLGPLGGIAAALAVCRSSHLVVLAVDLPRLLVAWFEQLRSVCTPGVGAIGWRADLKAYEPLAAIYPIELLSDARAALARDDCSLQKLAARTVAEKRLQSVTIASAQLTWFSNWNTPDDVVPC